MKKIIADIHCHPMLKPYGHCFIENSDKTIKIIDQSISIAQENSIYYQDSAVGHKVENKLFGQPRNLPR